MKNWYCKICQEQLTDFGDKFLIHLYQSGKKCHVTMWLKSAYPEELKQEEVVCTKLSE